ncbi:hypothetical protein IKM56_01725 [Candidatus Saccharibacteria bacterium]|nr:hypothetical protein [Candidatus Saccharibacteria bacterium]
MKNIRKRKPIALIIIFAFSILLSLLILLFINSRKLTDAEKIAIEEHSKPLINYLDNFETIEDREEQPTTEQQYIALAVDYFHFERSQDEIEPENLKTFIQENFNYEINLNDLEFNLQNELLSQKGTSASYEDDKIHLSYRDPSKKERAVISLNYYSPSEIKKKHGSYIVKYDRYIIESPYDMLNCLSESESDKTTDLMAYLNAKSNIASAQKAITKECAEKITEPKSSLKVTYKTKDNKFYIEKIEH